MGNKIAKVVVGLPLEGPFDYLVPRKISKDIQVGCRVWVQFGFRRLVGYVVGFSASSKFKKLRPVISLIDEQPVLSEGMLRFAREFAKYYFCSWAEAIEAMLPLGIRKGKEAAINKDLNASKEKGKFQGYLVHNFYPVRKSNLSNGVYPDKYQEVISGYIRDSLKKEKGVLFLVPEESYLKTKGEWLKENFKVRISVRDRKKAEKSQTEEWCRIRNGEVAIVLGTRSAVFAPMPRLGLVIVEEEDHSAYKQEQGPFYNTRDVALMRCQNEGAELVLTSPTPSLEAIYFTKAKGFKLIKVMTSNTLPQVQTVDLTHYQRRKERSNIFSYPLQDGLTQAVSNKEKVILFINRKGFSVFMRCKKCGFSLKCPRCNVGLTFHYDKNKLTCRYCNYKTEPLELCPQCDADYIRYLGAGDEKVESEVHRLFPQKKIFRIDSEKKARPGDFDILIATQAILKEPSAFSADLVAALQIDQMLNRLDFRSAEKTFAILLRLLRITRKKLILQTHNPQHYSIQAAAKADFEKFYKQELKFRRGLNFPPFCHFVAVGLRGKTEERVKTAALSVSEALNKIKPKSIEIFEAQPDMPAKLRGNYRWSILLKGKNIKAVNKLIRKAIKGCQRKSGIIISVNVDI